MQAVIEVIRGPLTGFRTQLDPGDDVLVGRLPECDLAIPEDPTISRSHCRLVADTSRLILTNLSPNGTQLNGQWVSEAELKEGDEVQIGQATAGSASRSSETTK